MSQTPPKSRQADNVCKWKCRDRLLPLNPDSPLIMGILNITPDSFSDGGSFTAPGAAVEHGLEMVRQGAHIIDVGGESTRPGAAPVDCTEEIQRVIPVIQELARQDVVVSVDTMKAQVAQAAIEAGAKIINDVSACSFDPAMPRIAAESEAGVVLMHMKGEPRTMQTNPAYNDLISEIKAFLTGRADTLINEGAAPESIMLDPGIGFGKTMEHNLQLLACIREFVQTGFPVLIGLSRKSFIGKITGREVNERLAGSLAGLVWCIMKGVHVLRVHDVKESVDAVKIIRALKEVR